MAIIYIIVLSCIVYCLAVAPDADGKNQESLNPGVNTENFTDTNVAGTGSINVKLDGGDPGMHTTSPPELVTNQDPCVLLCTCDMDNKHVDCSSRALNTIPSSLPANVHYLDLSGNNISSLIASDLERYSQLEQLDLSYNSLMDVSASVFMYSTSLQSLYIQHNQLNEGFFLCVEEVLVGENETARNESVDILCNITSLFLLDITHNQLSNVPAGLLEGYPQLEVLLLDYNNLAKIPQLISTSHPLHHISVTYNQLRRLDCSGMAHLSELHHLNLGYNRLEHVPQSMCSQYLHRLTTLTLSGNPFNALSPSAFNNLTYLSVLYLSDLQNLRYLPEDAFIGLPHLEKLILSYNPSLAYIHAGAFNGLDHLEVLDLSDCSLSWLHEHVLSNLTSVHDIRLTGNPWSCDCDLEWLVPWLLLHSPPHHTQTIICMDPPSLYGHNLLNATVKLNLACQDPVLVNQNTIRYFRIGRSGVIDCLVAGNPEIRVIWKTAKGQLLEYHPGYHDFYSSDPSRLGYHDGHNWHTHTQYYPNLDYSERIKVLYNGSLYIDYVTRTDTGRYTCYTHYEQGNQTAIIMVGIDTRIEWFQEWSIIIGFSSAFVFFFISMVTCSTYYCCVRWSAKERKRRKGIREVLNSLHDFKTVQIDRLLAYKTAKFNKLSVYKDAKIHKLVAFKTVKVDKLRNYKQVTVASIFHHLEKMREHYNQQMNKVKDNCTQQMDKLRENYTSQIDRINDHVDKIKDYKLDKVDQIKDNYHGQILKIRDYRMNQMDRLRDQYKLQQQHLLKLMELLDIGNCLTIVEAECMRTESMIFNPNISFDLEAEPIQRGLDLSDDESVYLTAGSQSDLSITDSKFGVAHSPLSDRPYRSHKTPQKQLSTNISESSSDASLSRPSYRDLEMLPPPNFHCDIPELDDQPLEQLVSDAEEAVEYYADLEREECGLTRFYSEECDDVSMYQTPPSSAHNNMTSGTAEVLAPGPAQESISTAYLSASQSIEHLPDYKKHMLHDHNKQETIV